MERTVKVWGKDYKVIIDQKSKSVWVAVGDYMGDRIEAQDRTESTALKCWREAAEYKGNG